jgi:hypothetical protein
MSREQACRSCKAILDWAKGEALFSLGVVELSLPERFAEAAADGIATALRTDDGRYFVLLKQTVGWKGNFEGVICCDAPLRSTELIQSQGERSYISIDDYVPFHELYVREGHGAECCEVYFDLN